MTKAVFKSIMLCPSLQLDHLDVLHCLHCLSAHHWRTLVLHGGKTQGLNTSKQRKLNKTQVKKKNLRKIIGNYVQQTTVHTVSPNLIICVSGWNLI